jgi:hypothetical protein
MSRTEVELPNPDIHGRRLVFLSVSDLSELLPLPAKHSPHFGLFLAMNGEDQSEDSMREITDTSIQAGLAHLSVWGKDCSRIHDLFDLASIRLEDTLGTEFPIMTTWHDKEDLSHALWFFAYCSIPHEEFLDSCADSFVVSVSNDEWAEELLRGLADLDGLSSRVAG